MNRKLPQVYSHYAFFRKRADNKVFILGDASDRQSSSFHPVLRHQKGIQGIWSGFVTLSNGTDVILGTEVADTHIGVIVRAIFGDTMADHILAEIDGKPVYTRIQLGTLGSGYWGLGRVRPKAVRPPRPEYIKEHTRFNITHCRVQSKPPKITRMSEAVSQEAQQYHARGGATVAMSFRPETYVATDDLSKKAYRIFFGVSLCSLLDGFDRKKGLDQAIGRALKAEESLDLLLASGHCPQFGPKAEGLKGSLSWRIDQDFYGTVLANLKEDDFYPEDGRGLRVKPIAKSKLVGGVLAAFLILYKSIRECKVPYRGDQDYLRFENSLLTLALVLASLTEEVSKQEPSINHSDEDEPPFSTSSVVPSVDGFSPAEVAETEQEALPPAEMSNATPPHSQPGRLSLRF